MSQPAGASGAPAANIRVYVRVRPLNSREVDSGCTASGACLVADPHRRTIEFTSSAQKGENRTFTFDHVSNAAETHNSQEDVFQKVGKPITDSCLAGYNGTILAYGQTGSGKTHTIQGPSADSSSATPSEHRGLMPRVFDYLMSAIAREERKVGSAVTYTCRASFLEIYNERIFDLLEPSGGSSLQLREDSKRGVFVEGLAEESVRSAADCLDLMQRGSLARRVGETALNRESSRSHSVFTLNIRSTSTQGGRTVEKNSRFSLVDLAGSERAKATQASGATLTEAKSINRSLSALGNVIRELMKRAQNGGGGGASGAPEPQGHVPYRDSKLTFLLRHGIGGNSLTYLVACVSSASSSFFESLSTVKFATMASAVRNCAKVNEDASASLEALREENELLKASMAKMMAATQLGARRLSAMPNSAYLYAQASIGHARESCVGLVTPSRLRAPASAVTRTPTAGVAPVAESSEVNLAGADLEQVSYLFAQSHARESAWLAEIDAHRGQISLLEAKQAHDALMMRLKDRQIAALKAQTTKDATADDVDQSLSEENASLRSEIETMRQYGLDVTHAPSLVEARNQVQILRDLLEKSGIDARDATATSSDLPSHRREFALQSQLLSLQEQVGGLTADLAASEERAASSEDLVSTRVRQLESDLASERDMVSHLESQLEHALHEASSKSREFEEAMLLKAGYVLRLEAERDALQRDIADLQTKASNELRAAAESQQAEVGVSSRLMAEVQSLQSRLDAAHAEARLKDEASFQLGQERALLSKQKADLTTDLAECKSKLASAEASAKSAHEEATTKIDDLHSRVSTLTADLNAANSSLAETTATVSSLQNECASWLTRFSSVQSAHDKLVFSMDNLQDDHDTLSSQFEFQEAELERTKQIVAAEQKQSAAHLQTITSLEERARERDEVLSKLRVELEEARVSQNYEAAFTSLLAEKTDLESTITDLRADAEQLETRLGQTEVDLRQSRAAESTSQAALSFECDKVRDLTSAVQDLSAKNAAHVSELAAVRDDANQSAAELAEVQEAHEELKAAHEAQTEQILARTTELAAANSLVGNLRTELHSASSERDRLATANSELDSSLQVANESLSKSADELSSARTRLVASEESTSQLTLEKSSLESKLSEIVSMAANLGASAAAEESAQKAAKQALKAVEAENDTLKSKLAVATAEATQAHGAFDRLQSTLDGLEKLRDARESELTTVRASLATAKEDIARVTGERDTLHAQAAEHTRSIATLQSDLATARADAEISSQDSAIALSLQSELHSLQERWTSALQERDVWMAEMESCRREEARQIDQLALVRTQLVHAEESLATANEQLAQVRQANAALEETNGQLIGHQNQRQKIQLHQQIKRENDQLRVEKAGLEREIKKFRKLHHLAGNAHATGALEKELAQADEHIRDGEQAVAQMEAIKQKIAAIDGKVRAATNEAAPASVLADITNSPSVAPSSAPTPFVASFPNCLAALSSFSSTFAHLSSQLDQSRREAAVLRSQAKLQTMKDGLAQQRRHAEQQGERAE